MILLWCILDMFVISLQGTCEFFIWSHITVFLNHLNLYIVWHLKWTCAAIVFLHLLSSASVLCRFCICQLYYLHRVQLPNVDDLDWNVVWVHHHHSLYQLLCASLCPEAKKLKNRKLTHWQGKWLLYNINVFLFFFILVVSPILCHNSNVYHFWLNLMLCGTGYWLESIWCNMTDFSMGLTVVFFITKMLCFDLNMLFYLTQSLKKNYFHLKMDKNLLKNFMEFDFIENANLNIIWHIFCMASYFPLSYVLPLLKLDLLYVSWCMLIMDVRFSLWQA